MFQGKVNSAIQLLAQHGKGGVLHADDNINLGYQGVKSVLDILHSKHPSASPTTPEALVMGNAESPSVHPVVYDQITYGVLLYVPRERLVPLVWTPIAGGDFAPHSKQPLTISVTPWPGGPKGLVPPSSTQRASHPCWPAV